MLYAIELNRERDCLLGHGSRSSLVKAWFSWIIKKKKSSSIDIRSKLSKSVNGAGHVLMVIGEVKI